MSRDDALSGGEFTWGEPPTVLLLVDGTRDRALLEAGLTDYEVTTGSPGDDRDAVDCVVVDDRSFRRVVDDLRERRLFAEPVFLPVLVVAGSERRAEQLLASDDADHVDDVVVAPTRVSLLRRRVASLLRTRALSLELDEERDQYKSLAETAQDAIVVFDERGSVQYANPAVESVFGRRPEAVTDGPITDLFVGETSADLAVARTVDESLVGRHADGHSFPVEVSVAAVDRDDGRQFTAIVRDVSAREAREQALSRSIDLLDQTQQIARVGGWEIDMTTGALTGTDEAYEIYDLPVDADLDYRDVIERFHPDGVADAFAALEAATTAGESFDIELRLAVDSPRWVRVKGEVDRSIDDAVVRGTVQDITERKLREREVERSHAMLDQSQRIGSIGGWELDLETERLVYTDEALRIHDLPVDATPSLEEAFGYIHPADEPRLRELVDRARDEGTPYDLECRLVTAEGRERWVRLQGLRDTSPDGVAVLRGTIQDVTDRKEREQQLERTVDLLDKTQAIANVGGWELDVETGDLLFTEETYRIHDVPVGERVDLEAAFGFYDPEDEPRVRAAVERAVEEGVPYDIECRLVTAEGRERWVRIQGLPEATAGGDVIRGTIQDVTERKEREQELERIVDLLDKTQETASVGGWEIDPVTEEVFWTLEVFDIVGLPVGEMPTLEEAFDLYHPEDRPVIADAVDDALTSLVPIDEELRIVRPSGEVRWVRVLGSPEVVDGEVVTLRGAFQDVTSQKRQARDRERSERRFRAVFEEATDAMVIANDDGEYVTANPAASELFGVPEDELLGRTIAEFAPPDYDFGSEWERFHRGENVTGEFPLVRPDGTRITVQFAATPNVLPGRHLSVLRDITERKARERDLERYETIVRAAADPIYAIDGSGRITLANEALAAATGRTVEDLLGANLEDLFDPADVEASVEHVSALTAGEDPGPLSVTLDTPNGLREYEVNVALRHETDEYDLPSTVGVARDVTDLHLRDQRLSVLDRVLRHNIRNRLNVVLGHASTLSGDDNATVRASASTIVDACGELLELSETARRFETALRPMNDHGAPLDLVEHLPHVVEDAHTTHPEATIDLELGDQHELWVTAHEALELAIEEVVENALAHTGPSPHVTVCTRVRPDSVVLEVTDDGPGLDRAERAALDRGLETPLEHMSGLGLWFVRWTVESSGGSMTVEDADPHGTSVVFELPAADPPT
jgi:PAS domain S-box-containing protein